MNLRILKKLSKRAAPLLPLLGDDREQFPAEKWESYTSVGGHDRKHWERIHSVHDSVYRGLIKYVPKHGKGWIAMHEPKHPLKGTPMVGAMSGYYEPEWDEETAWEALLQIVDNHFTAWNEDGPVWTGGRVDTPTRVFRALLESKPAVPQTLSDGAQYFACYLIDNCENEVIREESVQAWLGKMLASPRYHPTAPAQSCGDAEQADEAVTDAEPVDIDLIMARIPTVARLYYTGIGSRRYRRASTQTGPGEPLVHRSHVERELQILQAELHHAARAKDSK